MICDWLQDDWWYNLIGIAMLFVFHGNDCDVVRWSSYVIDCNMNDCAMWLVLQCDWYCSVIDFAMLVTLQCDWDCTIPIWWNLHCHWLCNAIDFSIWLTVARLIAKRLIATYLIVNFDCSYNVIDFEMWWLNVPCNWLCDLILFSVRLIVKWLIAMWLIAIWYRSCNVIGVTRG